MTSLRARLIVALVSLAAVGLVLLGGITYVTQRSFLLERVDEQTRAAAPALLRELAAGPAFPRAGGRRPGRPFGSEGPRGAAGLPSGLFGELRRADGEVVARATITYGEASLPRPELPDELPAGDVRTVPAVAGELRYRVRTVPVGPAGDVLVVALELRSVDEALDNLLFVEALVIGGVLLALALVASRLVRLGLRPLDRIATVAGQIAGGDLSRRVELDDPRTEVGRLGAAINGMLARLEAAFAEREASERRLRRFLADASHELRTPLSSIRGYAELSRMGAMPDADAVARALRRIEDESARMGALVEQLLVLARLDELPAPERSPVDVASLVEDVVADARAAAPDRVIVSTVAGAPVADGDPDALRQVLLNLVRNALVHTDAAVDVTARAAGEAVELEVRDRGPGLPRDDPGAVFGRFWRGEGPGRERGRAGAGLGLAIVAAIVEAHGGTVTARNDDGAVFTVRLPAVST